MTWQEQFDKRMLNWKFHHKKTPCVNDEFAVNEVKQFISNLLEEERERIIKLIKEKGLHLGYKNDIINLISSENK